MFVVWHVLRVACCVLLFWLLFAVWRLTCDACHLLCGVWRLVFGGWRALWVACCVSVAVWRVVVDV